MDESLPVQAERIGAEAVELDECSRREFIERSCRGDEALRREVEGFLTAVAASERYFDDLAYRLAEGGAVSEGTTARASAGAGHVGQRLGTYRLVEPIGSGGMGEVWRAARTDGRFEGHVAIKLLSRTTSRAAAERFEREGHYLARLAHPNIARLLDAGVSPDGLPYLVLEHIDGAAIDRYCDAQALTLRARIELFLNALAAVAHAHAHLMVHRDVKPSNVLVTPDGTVKLLDFGVAKLMSGDALAETAGLTRELGAALTPEYAAPEQFTGDVVSTAADVYSLGLLLYMLLAGRHPRRSMPLRSFDDMRELAIREPTPLRSSLSLAAPDDASLDEVARSRSTTPAELLRALRGDLDTILRKALAVDPQERYPSVAEFSSDLRRYLRHEPITAQPPTIGYRARKFVRRYRTAVIAATGVLITLVASTAMTTWQSIEARQQRDVALYQQQRVQATNEFLQLMLSEVGPGGQPLTPVQLLDRGVEMLDRQYGVEQRFMGRMLLTLANGYFSLGETARMLDLLDRAEQAARANSDADLLAAALCGMARLSNDAEAGAAHARVDEALGLLAGVSAPSADSFVSCARARARTLATAGDRPAAIQVLLDAKAELARTPAVGVENLLYLSNELSNLYYDERQIDRAAALNDTIRRTMERTGRAGTFGYIVISLNNAALLRLMGRIRPAYEIQTAVRERVGELESSGSLPPGFLGAYANSLLRLERAPEAMPILEGEIRRAAASGNRRLGAESQVMLAHAFVMGGRHAESAALLDSAEAFYREAEHFNDRMINVIAVRRARLLLAQGTGAEARAAIDRELTAAGYPQDLGAPDLVYRLGVAAEIALETGDLPAAERYATDCYEVAARVAGDPILSADVGDALLVRARARLARGDTAAAHGDLERALPPLVNGLGDEHPHTRSARELLRS
jgi:eukaryotic-like serine/threonine-protein kinase